MSRNLRLILSPTPHWERVRDFYRDVLGFPETRGWDNPGDRGVFLAGGTGELEIMEADVSVLGILPGSAPGWHPALEVTDLDGEYDRLQGLGVELVRGKRTHPWGSRDFVIRDPAGNALLIFEMPEGSGKE